MKNQLNLCIWLYVICCIFLIESAHSQQAGTLDNTFDFDGKVISPISAADARIFAIAIQPDDKIVAGGSLGSLTIVDFVLARYNSDGSLDSSFGSNGLVVTNILPNDYNRINDIALQSDGKILAAGQLSQNANSDFVIVRYNLDGSLDSAFGNNGIAIINISDGDWVKEIEISGSGKIYLAGTAKYKPNGSPDFCVVRLESSGNIDSSFNNTGKLIIDLGGDENLTSATLQPDDRIIITGSGVLCRVDTVGNLDLSFGNNGVVVTKIGMNSCVIQNDGKIIGGGGAYDSLGFGVFALERVNNDGSSDSTFNNNSVILFPPFNSGFDIIEKIKLQSNGSIVGAGYTNYPNPTLDFALICVDSIGQIDNAFGINGLTTTDFSTNYDLAFSIAIQSDSKIVAGGETFSANKWNFALARYHSGLNVGTIEHHDINNELSVYPNPVVKNEIFFSIDFKDISFSLYDSYGRLVYHINKFNGSNLAIPDNLKSGIYVLEIVNEKILFNKKIIIH